MLLNMAQPPEKVDEAAFQTCEAENSMMMAWLVNTMIRKLERHVRSYQQQKKCGMQSMRYSQI